jgi:hypothetical protein
MDEQHAISDWLASLASAVAEGRLVKLTLSKPTASAGDVTSVDMRPIMVKRALKLSLTLHHTTRDVVKNMLPAEAAVWVQQQLAEHFRAGYLRTTSGDFQLSYKNGVFRMQRHAATMQQAPALTHDRPKARLIAAKQAPYLTALGICDGRGEVIPSAQDKFRQINKYVEIMDGLLRDVVAKQALLRVVDMGAGKGYLTFALYDHVVHRLARPSSIIGVERRADLVQQSNAIARDAGFTGLEFVEGTIAQADCTHADAVIALHACDTATDDAIARAVHAQASLIVVAPCCHKQVRREMAAPPASHPLYAVLRHGTYRERMAEMLTDTLRAELLALQGYRCKVFEFIADAHTPKNVMIVAQRSAPLSAHMRAQKQAEIARLKAEFGIAQHALEAMLPCV